MESRKGPSALVTLTNSPLFVLLSHAGRLSSLATVVKARDDIANSAGGASCVFYVAKVTISGTGSRCQVTRVIRNWTGLESSPYSTVCLFF